MLRELSERKLINAYARHSYNSHEDVENDEIIKQNLISLLDWDKNGDNGLGIYCGKFEKIKRKDWKVLINIIKDNKLEIRNLSYAPRKRKRLENIKYIKSIKEKLEEKRKIKFSDENYKESFRAKGCEYNGKHYSSRQECIYKENITKAELYKYLALTNQLSPKSSLIKKYKR